MVEPVTLQVLTGIKTFLDCLVLAKDNMKQGPGALSHNFEHVIKPVYTELEPLVSDYYAMFRAAREELGRIRARDETSYWDQIDLAVANLRASREKMLLARVTVREQTFIMAQRTRDRREGRFFRQVSEIFDAPEHGLNLRPGVSMGNWVVTVAELVSEREAGSVHTLSRSLESATDFLVGRWEAVNRSYSALRFEQAFREGKKRREPEGQIDRDREPTIE